MRMRMSRLPKCGFVGGSGQVQSFWMASWWDRSAPPCRHHGESPAGHEFWHRNPRLCLLGSKTAGIGFLISVDEASNLIALEPKAEDVVFPLLSGKDLTASPSLGSSRWVINFRDWSLAKAQEYPECLRIVQERVKPQRDALADSKRQVARSLVAIRAPRKISLFGD